MSQTISLLKEVFDFADIQINGDKPHDIQIEEHFLELLANEFLSRGNLGLGELFEAGIWDCNDIQEFYRHLLEREVRKFWQQNPAAIATRPTTWPALAQFVGLNVHDIYRHQLTNLQEKEHAYEIGEAHYDNVHEYAEAMLGPWRKYSCGHWQNADTLKSAQEEDMQLLCDKMKISTGDKLLDVGCGWGSMMEYAVQKYDVEAVGITVSQKQADYINNELGESCSAYILDYREIEANFSSRFDCAVSIGMFEHVGPKNYEKLVRSVRAALKPSGRFALQSIAMYKRILGTDPWIDKYIFPRGKFPTISQAESAIAAELDLIETYDFAEPISNPLNAYYKQTLDAWWSNFVTSLENNSISVSERIFRRMRLYLHMCAAMFSGNHPNRATVIQVVGEK